MYKAQEPKICPVCDAEMIFVDHWEDDGFEGSHEPYWECPNGCKEDEMVSVYDRSGNRHNLPLQRVREFFIDVAGYSAEEIDDAPVEEIKELVTDLNSEAVDELIAWCL